jgi:hypothetical protein
MDLGLGLEKDCGLWSYKPWFTNVFDFLIGGRKKKRCNTKKIKNFQFAQKQYPKTHTHTHTHTQKPILLEIEPHTRGETNKA